MFHLILNSFQGESFSMIKSYIKDETTIPIQVEIIKLEFSLKQFYKQLLNLYLSCIFVFYSKQQFFMSEWSHHFFGINKHYAWGPCSHIGRCGMVAMGYEPRTSHSGVGHSITMYPLYLTSILGTSSATQVNRVRTKDLLLVSLKHYRLKKASHFSQLEMNVIRQIQSVFFFCLFCFCFFFPKK